MKTLALYQERLDELFNLLDEAIDDEFGKFYEEQMDMSGIRSIVGKIVRIVNKVKQERSSCDDEMRDEISQLMTRVDEEVEKRLNLFANSILHEGKIEEIQGIITEVEKGITEEIDEANHDEELLNEFEEETDKPNLGEDEPEQKNQGTKLPKELEELLNNLPTEKPAGPTMQWREVGKLTQEELKALGVIPEEDEAERAILLGTAGITKSTKAQGGMTPEQIADIFGEQEGFDENNGVSEPNEEVVAPGQIADIFGEQEEEDMESTRLAKAGGIEIRVNNQLYQEALRAKQEESGENDRISEPSKPSMSSKIADWFDNRREKKKMKKEIKEAVKWAKEEAKKNIGEALESENKPAEEGVLYKGHIFTDLLSRKIIERIMAGEELKKDPKIYDKEGNMFRINHETKELVEVSEGEIFDERYKVEESELTPMPSLGGKRRPKERYRTIGE